MRRGDVVFLAAMIALYLACVVRNPRSDTYRFLSFDPLPDAIEYALDGAELAAGRDPALTIDGVRIPSRYPPGFPLVIAAAYRVLGNDVAHAYWVSIACGAAAVVLGYVFACVLLASRAIARWTAFFLATSSLTLSFAPLVMSELCSLDMALVGLILAVRLGPVSRLGGFVLLGAVLGFGVVIRSANVVLIPLTLLVLLPYRGLPSPTQASALAAPLVLAAASLAAYNFATFGSPLRDGYAFYTPRPLFAWTFFVEHAPSYVRTLFLARGGKTLWLDGPFYGLVVPSLFVLGIVALFRAGRRDVVGLVAAWVIGFVVVLGSYFFFDFRFFVPLLPMILMPAACGAASLVDGYGPRGRAVATAAIALLYLAQPIGSGTSPLAAARRNRLDVDPPRNYLQVQAVNAFMQRVGAEPDTDVLVTALNLAYHDHFSNQRYRLQPLSPIQDYAWVSEIRARLPWRSIDELLAAGRRVYVTDFAADDEEAKTAFQTIAEHYRLETVDAGARLARVQLR